MKSPGRRIKETYRKIMAAAGYKPVTTAIPGPRMEAVLTALCNRLCPSDPQRAYDYAYDQVARACAGIKYRPNRLTAFSQEGALMAEELERVTGKCELCGRSCSPDHFAHCGACVKTSPGPLTQS